MRPESEHSLSLKIRKAEPGDFSQLLALFEQGDQLHRESLPEIFRKPEGKPREKDYFEDLLQQPEVGFFIAQEENQIVGFVHAVIKASPALAIFVTRRFVVVDAIVVRTDFQGMGIGRKLMETVHEWAIDRGVETVELNVYEFNKDAVSFYRRLGYETLSRKMHRSLFRRHRDIAD
jgi:ribosomal protein S18 acetylase RimI-like enzyme